MSRITAAAAWRSVVRVWVEREGRKTGRRTPRKGRGIRRARKERPVSLRPLASRQEEEERTDAYSNTPSRAVA